MAAVAAVELVVITIVEEMVTAIASIEVANSIILKVDLGCPIIAEVNSSINTNLMTASVIPD